MKIPSFDAAAWRLPLQLPVVDASGESRPKLAPTWVDTVEEASRMQPRGSERMQYAWDRDLEQNVVHIIENSTGDVARKALTDAQKDHMLRTRNIVGRHVDAEA